MMMVYLLMVICVLVSVAFITLLERKILGYIQYRKGPNKLGIMGIFQPFADAVKLLFKDNSILLGGNKIIFYFSPCLSFILMLLLWMIIYWVVEVGFMYEIMIFILISSLGVYALLGAGWASNSKYALLGAYRGIAQMISYEISLSFIILCIFLMSMGFKLEKILFLQSSMWLMFGMWNLFLLWLVTILAETNRTPFDFSEGESELVSGFNIEYGSGGFVMLFLAEYGNIIYMSLITSYMFMGGVGIYCWKTLLLILFYLFIRGTLIRYRYDSLMMLGWKVILPYSIFNLLIFFMVFIFSI